MAKAVRKKNVRTAKNNKSAKKTAVSPFSIYWKKQNYILLLAGFILLFAGYYIMSIKPWNSFPALNISPVILIIAYIVIFPAAILYREKKKSGKSEATEIAPDKGKEQK
jgi:membrane protein YdbS with pleckstrin-like domain